MMMMGLFAYLVCIAIAFAGKQLGNYWVSLVLLGVGWNFLFIGATTFYLSHTNPANVLKCRQLTILSFLGYRPLLPFQPVGLFLLLAGKIYCCLICHLFFSS